MAIVITLDELTLPEFRITPEFRSLVRASVSETVGGGVVIQESSILSGKAIDLVGDESSCFMTKSDIDYLTSKASIPGASYVLSYLGTLYTVRFRNEDQPVIDAVPVIDAPDLNSNDYYHSITIKLMIL